MINRIFLSLFIAISWLPVSQAQSISNNSWKDTGGHHINAHGGGVIS